MGRAIAVFLLLAIGWTTLGCDGKKASPTPSRSEGQTGDSKQSSSKFKVGSVKGGEPVKIIK
jgi:hypothetical protein